MTATDELRRLLDERGVEYEARTSPTGGIWTYWDAFNGHRVYARDNENGTVKIFGEWDVTPEQAIEATLGRGECSYEIAAFGDGKAWYQCSECGGMASADYDPPKYCPHCGAKVVSE